MKFKVGDMVKYRTYLIEMADYKPVNFVKGEILIVNEIFPPGSINKDFNVLAFTVKSLSGMKVKVRGYLFGLRHSTERTWEHFCEDEFEYPFLTELARFRMNNV